MARIRFLSPLRNSANFHVKGGGGLGREGLWRWIGPYRVNTRSKRNFPIKFHATILFLRVFLDEFYQIRNRSY